MINDWYKFCSGSDIRGTAIEGVANQPVDLTDEVVTNVTLAFCYFLQKKLNKDRLIISVGRDSRLSGERIESSVITALLDSGVAVIRCGLASTPSMFMTIVDENVRSDGAIQITASHHPFNKNGLKFFTSDGGLEHSDILNLLNCAMEHRHIEGGFGEVIDLNYIDIYAGGLVEKVRKATGLEQPLKGLKIIVDAGNGVGGFYATKVLQPLGANTDGSQFLEPDGNFPNHIPNPEDDTAMQSIKNAVISNNADYGIIFDTDVDRAGMVDKSGEEINRNALIAVISKILLDEKTDATIVTDSITSSGLNKFIINNGGVHHRFKRGYKNVINEAMRLNSLGIYTPLAIETSGHAALAENYFLDDGAYLVTRILITVAKLNSQGKKLSDLIAGLEAPVESAEIRLTFYEENFVEYGKLVISNLVESISKSSVCRLATSNYEGARAEFDKGWVLMRMSVHDPIMPINIESDEVGYNKVIAKWLYEQLKSFRGINTKKLLEYINN